jgi:hypothetical protein
MGFNLEVGANWQPALQQVSRESDWTAEAVTGPIPGGKVVLYDGDGHSAGGGGEGREQPH